MTGSKRSQPDRRGDVRSKAPYPRVARVNALLMEVIAEALEPLMDEDDRLGLLTVTGVATEPGLRSATVFISSLTPAAASALAEHRHSLQAAIGRSVRMKRTPLLEFRQDPAVVNGERVESALRRIERHHE
ncbi:MAG: ribosome-binding factor A [Acidimicrobiales bacterium]